MDQEFNLDKAVKAIRDCLPGELKVAGLHEPIFRGNEYLYVKDCLDTGWVSSAGKYTELFERNLTDYTGTKEAVALVNGTAALHICLLLAGVEANDEVLMPPLTFVATANAVAYCGAVPHFVDVEERTLGLDPFRLQQYLDEIAVIRLGECFNKQTGRRIKAVVPVHTFGHPVDLDPLAELSMRFCLEIVEDAAESLGSLYKGIHTGNLGRLSSLSFNGNKIVTTGGGGALLTSDQKMAKLARHITTTAKLPHRWAYFHDRVGYNYRLPNINAALGCAQLEQLPLFVEMKRALADKYRQAFLNLKGAKLFLEPHFARSNYWLNVLILDSENASIKEELLAVTNSMGLATRPAWTLMHKLPAFQKAPAMDLSVAESLESRIINLPSGAGLYENIRS